MDEQGSCEKLVALENGLVWPQQAKDSPTASGKSSLRWLKFLLIGLAVVLLVTVAYEIRQAVRIEEIITKAEDQETLASQDALTIDEIEKDAGMLEMAADLQKLRHLFEEMQAKINEPNTTPLPLKVPSTTEKDVQLTDDEKAAFFEQLVNISNEIEQKLDNLTRLTERLDESNVAMRVMDADTLATLSVQVSDIREIINNLIVAKDSERENVSDVTQTDNLNAPDVEDENTSIQDLDNWGNLESVLDYDENDRHWYWKFFLGSDGVSEEDNFFERISQSNEEELEDRGSASPMEGSMEQAFNTFPNILHSMPSSLSNHFLIPFWWTEKSEEANVSTESGDNELEETTTSGPETKTSKGVEEFDSESYDYYAYGDRDDYSEYTDLSEEIPIDLDVGRVTSDTEDQSTRTPIVLKQDLVTEKAVFDVEDLVKDESLDSSTFASPKDEVAEVSNESRLIACYAASHEMISESDPKLTIEEDVISESTEMPLSTIWNELQSSGSEEVVTQDPVEVSTVDSLSSDENYANEESVTESIRAKVLRYAASPHYKSSDIGKLLMQTEFRDMVNVPWYGYEDDYGNYDDKLLYDDIIPYIKSNKNWGRTARHVAKRSVDETPEIGRYNSPLSDAKVSRWRIAGQQQIDNDLWVVPSDITKERLQEKLNNFYAKMEAVSAHIDRLQEKMRRTNVLNDDYVSMELTASQEKNGIENPTN